MMRVPDIETQLEQLTIIVGVPLLIGLANLMVMILEPVVDYFIAH